MKTTKIYINAVNYLQLIHFIIASLSILFGVIIDCDTLIVISTVQSLFGTLLFINKSANFKLVGKVKVPMWYKLIVIYHFVTIFIIQFNAILMAFIESQIIEQVNAILFLTSFVSYVLVLNDVDETTTIREVMNR